MRTYNPYFYIDSKNPIILGILSKYSDYNITFQGIFSDQIELYDNTNFTLNTLFELHGISDSRIPL